MPRVKRAVSAHKKRRTVLNRAKGCYGAKSRSYRAAKEQVQHSLQYMYRDRRNKKREIRRLWITRINAAARINFRFMSFVGLSHFNRLRTGPSTTPRRSPPSPRSPRRLCRLRVYAKTAPRRISRRGAFVRGGFSCRLSCYDSMAPRTSSSLCHSSVPMRVWARYASAASRALPAWLDTTSISAACSAR